jgi:hypothetical protein
MPKKGFYKDLSGRKFGKLIVLKYEKHKGHTSCFLCKCSCGNEVVTYSNNLQNGHTTSCGHCIQIKIGKKYGRLLVIKCIKNLIFLCRCNCGNNITVKSNNLLSGNTKSCGCLKGELAIDMIGKKSGYLEVIGRAGSTKSGQARWKCKCHNCNAMTIVDGKHLRRNTIRSCGCIQGRKNIKKLKYKGIYYRSGFELIIALAFEHLNIPFKYEPRKFKLIIGKLKVWYIPDFYLPTLNLWVEVKGYKYKKSMIKYTEFSSSHKSLLIDENNLKLIFKEALATFYMNWGRKGHAICYMKNRVKNGLNFNDSFRFLLCPL